MRGRTPGEQPPAGQPATPATPAPGRQGDGTGGGTGGGTAAPAAPLAATASGRGAAEAVPASAAHAGQALTAVYVGRMLRSRPGSAGVGVSPGAGTPASALAAGRPYGRPGGLARVPQEHQRALADRFPLDAAGQPACHPDPWVGDWTDAVNDGGYRRPGRSGNCLDVALSGVDTYSGLPTCASARTPDAADGAAHGAAHGTADGAMPPAYGPDRGEHGGRDRAERGLGSFFHDLGEGPAAFERVEDLLRRAGHGAQTLLITRDPAGRAHAWNAVHHDGRITYLDYQTGRRARDPLYSGQYGVWGVSLACDGSPLDPAAPTGPRMQPAAGPAPRGVRLARQVDLCGADSHLDRWASGPGCLPAAALAGDEAGCGVALRELEQTLPGLGALDRGLRGAVLLALAWPGESSSGPRVEPDGVLRDPEPEAALRGLGADGVPQGTAPAGASQDLEPADGGLGDSGLGDSGLGDGGLGVAAQDSEPEVAPHGPEPEAAPPEPEAAPPDLPPADAVPGSGSPCPAAAPPDGALRQPDFTGSTYTLLEVCDPDSGDTWYLADQAAPVASGSGSYRLRGVSTDREPVADAGCGQDPAMPQNSGDEDIAASLAGLGGLWQALRPVATASVDGR